MTDRAAPGAQGSTVRNMEYGEMGGAPAPFLVPYGELSRAAQRWDDLDDPEEVAASEGWADRGPFSQNPYSKKEWIRLNPGEGYVDGWFATDEIQQFDLSPYQGEEITLVVGWDPDAVYSSDVHDNREDADRVFVDVEQEVDDDMPYIPLWRGPVVETGNGGLIIGDPPTDLRPIGRPMETLGAGLPAHDERGEDTKGPGVNLLRGRPTTFTGAVDAGPFEATQDRANTIVADVPVTDDLDAGEEVSYVLQAGGNPVLKVYAEANGSGGVQNLRIDSMGNQLQDVSGNESADSMTANPESDPEDGYIEVVLNGTTYQIPIYAEV